MRPPRASRLRAVAWLSLVVLFRQAHAQQAAGAFDCQATLSRPTVVIFFGPEAPWLGDLTSLMPTHTINTTSGDVGLLPLSQPDAAACARSITDITDTLILWEDGKLPAAVDALPRGLVRTRPRGQLIVKGKQGRAVPGGPQNLGLTDLSFLQGLQSIGGLSVYDMDGLTTLTGLEQLTTITGDLIVSENDNLENVTGLNALRQVTGDLLMNSNMRLKTLDGLGALQSVGGQLLLKGNGDLLNIDALSSLQRVGTTASFPNNGNLQMRLPSTVAVGPNATVPTPGAPGQQQGNSVVVIYGGATPPTVDAVLDACDTFMPPLTKFDISVQRVVFHPAAQPVPTAAGGNLTGNVIVFDDGAITSLRPALGAVTNVSGSLLVVGGVAVGSPATSAGLANLDGLQAIQTVGELGVVGATQLTDMSGLSSLTAIQNNLVVMFSPSIVSLNGLGAAVGGLATIGSELWIEGNYNMTSVQGLQGLTTVGWRFSIRDCPRLASLDALQALRHIGGGLVLLDNFNLTSLAGLASLRTVGGGITLMWNSNLTDISGFARLTRLPGDFSMAGNPITSLAPLKNLRSVGLQFVVSRSNVTDLSGLGALTTVGGGVSFTANPYLTSLTGLNALNAVGDDLSIRQNPRLSSLAPMDSTLKTVGGGVYIEDNPALRSLGNLPQTISGIGGLVVVRRNGGIPSVQASTLRDKSTKTSGVPDTVALLPGLITQYQQALAQSAYPGDDLMVPGMPGVATMGNATRAPMGPPAVAVGSPAPRPPPVSPTTAAFG